MKPEGGPDGKIATISDPPRGDSEGSDSFVNGQRTWLGKRRRDQFRDLRGVERRALAQVVTANEELDAVRVVE
jgi:hypothetical protein